MSDFDLAFKIIAGPKVEGKLSVDAADKGNWTGGDIGKGTLKGSKYGISAAMYPDENILMLTQERAKFLYKRDYWDKWLLDSVEWGKAILVFDTAINGGHVGQWWQEAPAKLEEFVAFWQSTHLHWLASLPTWEHEKGGWISRAFYITVQALRKPT
jgi:lysozyme family protein